MAKTVAVMQPYFFPYVGYFSLIDSVDEFIFFDDVQYVRKSWMGRNSLLNIASGEPFYIRPGIDKPPYRASLSEVKLQDNSTWQNKILDQTSGYKNKAPYYEETIHLINKCFTIDTNSLLEFNIESTKIISGALGINVSFTTYSHLDLGLPEDLEPGKWGLEIAKAVNASRYINSPGGESFIKVDGFEANEIKLGFIQPEIQPYNQFTGSFVPGLSILDLLFFNGPEKTAELLKAYHVKWLN